MFFRPTRSVRKKERLLASPRQRRDVGNGFRAYLLYVRSGPLLFLRQRRGNWFIVYSIQRLKIVSVLVVENSHTPTPLLFFLGWIPTPLLLLTAMVYHLLLITVYRHLTLLHNRRERFNVHELLHRLSGVVNRVQYSWEK